MSLSLISAVCCLILLGAYLFFGKLLSRFFSLDDSRSTPACALNDGIDFVPAKKNLLLGQHFSAIAAASPIVGPILAGLWFGWLPALLWIIFGSIFIGAVHDFASLVGSLRHGARSIAEIVKEHIGPNAYRFFLIYIWISLVYVITAFTDLTSASFVEPQFGGGVATSSVIYLFIGIAMGVSLTRLKMPLWLATLIYVPIVGFTIWFGQSIPLVMPAWGGIRPQMMWNIFILLYCFAASVLPMWILLQPRGYLGGFFLYGSLAAGLIGLFLSGSRVQYPAFLGFSTDKGMTLFPMLFVTIACGACSGFHGLVSSGTTSKQVHKETDAKLIGYGGMLLEALVGVIALATLMLLTPGDALLGESPDRIYANGLSRFVSTMGINPDFARSFALLAFATFIYDTLDVSTRLGRYVFQELTGWKGWRGSVAATVLTLAAPAYCVSLTVMDARGNIVPAWKTFWTIFGTSNQLLAALTLLGLTVWLKKEGKPGWITAFPMGFMMVMALWSLERTIAPWAGRLFSGSSRWEFIPIIAIVLVVLSSLLIIESVKTLRRFPPPHVRP